MRSDCADVPRSQGRHCLLPGADHRRACALTRDDTTPLEDALGPELGTNRWWMIASSGPRRIIEVAGCPATAVQHGRGGDGDLGRRCWHATGAALHRRDSRTSVRPAPSPRGNRARSTGLGRRPAPASALRRQMISKRSHQPAQYTAAGQVGAAPSVSASKRAWIV